MSYAPGLNPRTAIALSILALVYCSSLGCVSKTLHIRARARELCDLRNDYTVQTKGQERISGSLGKGACLTTSATYPFSLHFEFVSMKKFVNFYEFT